jgi:hypothetical protein
MNPLITKQKELETKEKQLEQLIKKINKGEISGNGAPHLVLQLESEIYQLKDDIFRINRNAEKKLK